MDRHSFRELWLLIGGARKREIRKWEHTLAVCQAVWNWGGPRGPKHKPKALGEMHKELFPDGHPARVEMTMGDYKARMAEHDKRFKARYG